MAIDKNQAVINFLLQCPQIASSKLFFNFINGSVDDKQIITTASDRQTHKPFIDGSVMKRYTFTIIDFRSVTYQAIVKTTTPGYPNENVEEMLDVQGIVDWVMDKAEAREFPDFGTDCVIDGMKTLTDTPNLNGVDRQASPPLAKYSIAIQIDYIDNTKRIWN